MKLRSATRWVHLGGWVLLLALAAGCRFDPSGASADIDGAASSDGGVDAQGPDADLSPPEPPLGIAVPEVVGVCPAQTVNLATASGVGVVVTLSPAARATDQVHLRIAGGAVAVPAPLPAPAGGGPLTFTADLSALDDGVLSLAAWVQTADASTLAVTTAAYKDTEVVLLVDPVVTPTVFDLQRVSGLTEAGATVQVGNATTGATAVATADAEGYFEAPIPLQLGLNPLDVRATDALYNEVTVFADRHTGSLLVERTAGDPVGVFSSEGATRLGPVSASTPCTESAAAAFTFVRAPDLASADVAPDLFVGCRNELFLNDGQGLFTHEPVPFVGDRAAVWGDFDNDGDWDVALSRWVGTQLRIYRNERIPSGTVSFSEPVGMTPFDPSNPEGLAWLDYDLDGWLDLFVADGGLNELLQNDGTGQLWSPVGNAQGVNNVAPVLEDGGWIAVSDFDVNGRTDVALSDDVGNGFLLSNDTGYFSDVTAATSCVFANPFKRGLTFADFDGDGHFDLFSPRGGAGGAANALLRYDAATQTFTDVAAVAGVDLPTARDGAAWGDVDNDGRLDLVYYQRAAGDPTISVVVQRNAGDVDSDGVPDFETYTQTHALVDGVSFDAESTLLADVDNDGDLDLFIASRDGHHLLLMNPATRPAGAGHAQNPRYLRVLLFGNGVSCNRSALGSVVVLRDCDGGQLLAAREVNGGRGNGGQESPVLHFGGLLPSKCVEVEARFAGGPHVVQQVRPIELPGQTLLVFQP